MRASATPSTAAEKRSSNPDGEKPIRNCALRQGTRCVSFDFRRPGRRATTTNRYTLGEHLTSLPSQLSPGGWHTLREADLPQMRVAVEGQEVVPISERLMGGL